MSFLFAPSVLVGCLYLTSAGAIAASQSVAGVQGAPVAATGAEIADVASTSEVAETAPGSEVAETAPAADEDQAVAAVAFADVADDALVDRALASIEAIGALSGDFEQTAPSGAISTGRFWLRRPGQIRFEYDAPSPLLIVATQGNVYVRDSALDQTDLYPLKKTPLRFLLDKRVELDDEIEVRGVERGASAIAVTFGSRDPEAEGELIAVFSAPDLALREWAVRDAQDGLTIVTLANTVADGDIDNRLFRAPEAGGRFIKN